MSVRSILLVLLVLVLSGGAVPSVVASTSACKPQGAAAGCCCNGGGCPMSDSEARPTAKLDCACARPEAELPAERSDDQRSSERPTPSLADDALRPVSFERHPSRAAERPPGRAAAPTYLLHRSILC